LRLTTDIWTFAFLRMETSRGAFATIVKKGAFEAGAIYVVENLLEGIYNVYGPAPQSLVYEAAGDRMFESVMLEVAEKEVEKYLAKQMNFDPDIWVIETECRHGPPALELIDGNS